jgi:hypothetical protein
MNIRSILVSSGVLVVLAGCTVRSGGEPIPGSESRTASTSETSTPKYANLLPPRPRELDLAGVDPCADLLTNQQLRELNYDLGYARPPLPGHSLVHGGPDCTFSSNGGSGGVNRKISTQVSIATTEGALMWVTDPAREPDARPAVVGIQGFHALVLPHPDLPDNCMIVVDTAEGQYLEVSSTSADGSGKSAEPYCEEGKLVADLAIRTISASR